MRAKARTEAEILEALRKTQGNISAAARALKLDRRCVYDRIQKSEKLQQAMNDERENLIDEAENALLKAIRRGEGWAVTLALKTQGKKRGYVEKTEQEISGPNGGPIETAVRVIRPRAENDGNDED